MYVDNLVNKHGIFLRIINSLIFIIFCIDMISAQSFQLTPFPECDLNINVKKGLSSPCVGVHNDCLFLAGGCNFPDLPIIQGGKKRFYDDIYIISSVSEGNTAWRSAGKLPYSLAYGVTLSTPYGIIIIGGCNESGSINNVLNVNWDVERNSLKVDSVNQLPYEMFNMGGTYCDECCYIAGGIVDGIPSNKFLALYNDSNKGWKWEELEDFPGSPRIQPIVVALTVYGKKRIYIWGGFSTSSKYTSSNISVDGYYYDVDERTWHYAGFIFCEGTNSPISVGGESVLL